MAHIIDGKAIAAAVRGDIAAEVARMKQESGVTPGLAVILVVFALEMRNPGFTVTFDARGGTDVPAQNQMYGELKQFPEPPTREGYTFTGWYRDPNCDQLWRLEIDIVDTDLTLYAGWQKNE